MDYLVLEPKLTDEQFNKCVSDVGGCDYDYNDGNITSCYHTLNKYHYCIGLEQLLKNIKQKFPDIQISGKVMIEFDPSSEEVKYFNGSTMMLSN